MDVAGIFLVFFVADLAENLLGHDFREADDGIQGGAQFVTHVGQELAFGGVGVLGFFQGVEKLAFRLQPVADLLVQVIVLAFDNPVGAPDDGEQQPVQKPERPHQSNG